MPMFVQVKTPINLKKDRSRAHKRKHIFLQTNCVAAYGPSGAELNRLVRGETEKQVTRPLGGGSSSIACTLEQSSAKGELTLARLQALRSLLPRALPTK